MSGGSAQSCNEESSKMSCKAPHSIISPWLGLLIIMTIDHLPLTEEFGF